MASGIIRQPDDVATEHLNRLVEELMSFIADMTPPDDDGAASILVHALLMVAATLTAHFEEPERSFFVEHLQTFFARRVKREVDR